jgi:predicted small secreted protein
VAMAKKFLLIIVLIIVICSTIGCQTAQGLKGDVTYIGDKTAEIIDKEE